MKCKALRKNDKPCPKEAEKLGYCGTHYMIHVKKQKILWNKIQSKYIIYLTYKITDKNSAYKHNAKDMAKDLTFEPLELFKNEPKEKYISINLDFYPSVDQKYYIMLCKYDQILGDKGLRSIIGIHDEFYKVEKIIEKIKERTFEPEDSINIGHEIPWNEKGYRLVDIEVYHLELDEYI